MQFQWEVQQAMNQPWRPRDRRINYTRKNSTIIRNVVWNILQKFAAHVDLILQKYFNTKIIKFILASMCTYKFSRYQVIYGGKKNVL